MPGKRREAIRRRRRGGKLLLEGKSPRQVAEQVGVSRQTAYAWKASLRRSGENLDVFADVNRGGRPARLRSAEKDWLQVAVCDRPATHQLPGSRWSLKLVQRLIERQFGVDLSASRISRLLRELDLPLRSDTAIDGVDKRRRKRSRT